jgi:hypothetical protein
MIYVQSRMSCGGGNGNGNLQHCDHHAHHLEWLQDHITCTNVNTLRRDCFLRSTELHFASKLGCQVCVQWLVEQRGADIQVIDKAGYTPLHDSVLYNRREIVLQLLRYKAHVHTPDTIGHTALSTAILRAKQNESKINKDIIIALIDRGAKFDHKTAPQWLIDLVQGREKCLKIYISLLGIRRHIFITTGNGRDVIGLIVSMVWATRLATLH